MSNVNKGDFFDNFHEQNGDDDVDIDQTVSFPLQSSQNHEYTTIEMGSDHG